MNTLSTVSSTTLCYKKIIAIIANPFFSGVMLSMRNLLTQKQKD